MAERPDPDTDPAPTMHAASPNEVLDEVERRLRDTEWSSHAEDRCRVALLHIDAYREGRAMAPDPDPNTLADRLDFMAQHPVGGYRNWNADLRAAADGLRQLADENRALREQLDAAQLRSIEARNPGIDMEEVRRVRLAYPDPERHETVSRAKYGASLAADPDKNKENEHG